MLISVVASAAVAAGDAAGCQKGKQARTPPTSSCRRHSPPLFGASLKGGGGPMLDLVCSFLWWPGWLAGASSSEDAATIKYM